MIAPQVTPEQWRAMNPFAAQKSFGFNGNWSDMGYYPTVEAAKQACADAESYYEPGEYDGSMFCYRVIGPDGEEVQ